MRARAAWIGLAVVAVVLSLGFAELFRLRFARGDVYPYGSSLRSDPLGAKVLYDALEEVPEVAVERNERALERLTVDRSTAVLLLGLPAPELDPEEGTALEQAMDVARRGARVVVALRPEEREPWWSDENDGPAGGPGAPVPPTSPKPKAKHSDERAAPRTRWLALPADEQGKPRAASATASADTNAEDALPDLLPDLLPIRTGLVFADPAPAWRVLFRRDGHPVALERRVGAGSLVLLADSYLFSNQAMLSDRQTRLLSWALGEATRVVFDESHLGVDEQAGVMVLAQRYRLQPFLAALAVLAALFVWRSSSRLLPPSTEPVTRPIDGGDAASGLAKLLTRGIPRREVLALCAQRWLHDCGRARRDASQAVAQLARDSTDPADPVAGYGRIRDTLLRLQHRKGKHVE